MTMNCSTLGLCVCVCVCVCVIMGTHACVYTAAAPHAAGTERGQNKGRSCKENHSH